MVILGHLCEGGPAALTLLIVHVFIHHCDAVLLQLLSEVMLAVVNPVWAAHYVFASTYCVLR